ncbi:MAG: transposase [Kiritimatiellaeota bacterium]|nr:transposase [Kiritimatiellota bacterium]
MHSHLRRLERVFVSHPIYFITTNTRKRCPSLAGQAAADIIIAEWRNARRRHGWGIGRYVIMPDHVHFFCVMMPMEPQQASQPLADMMQAWKQWTAKRLARQLLIPTPIWQEEFFDHVLRSADSYAEKWTYVRENPVRKGLVISAEDWPWQGSIDFDSPLQS